MEALKIVLLVIGAYFLGNINNALLISKLKGKDVRKLGSGNAGTMNMARNFGVPIGILTLSLDVLKGVIPTLIGWLIIGTKTPMLTDNRLGAYIGGLSVIVGHIFPVCLKFKGGKGIASTVGICLVLHPVATPIVFALAVTFLYITKLGSVTSFIAISFPLGFAGFWTSNHMESNSVASLILIFALFMLTLFAHRKNVIKLFLGTESKTLAKKKKPVSEPIF